VQPATLTLKSTEASYELWGANYVKPTGLQMIKKAEYFSPDNGATWSKRPPKPDFDSDVPHGHRRGQYAPVVDPVNGNIVTVVLSLDQYADPNIAEPRIGEKAYYLRYRVSTDGGVTYLFDEPMVQVGKTQANPFDGVYTGRNGYYIGDGSGDRIIHTQSSRLIVPAQASVLGSDGQFVYPQTSNMRAIQRNDQRIARLRQIQLDRSALLRIGRRTEHAEQGESDNTRRYPHFHLRSSAFCLSAPAQSAYTRLTTHLIAGAALFRSWIRPIQLLLRQASAAVRHPGSLS
jgi:hypothetical protein